MSKTYTWWIIGIAVVIIVALAAWLYAVPSRAPNAPIAGEGTATTTVASSSAIQGGGTGSRGQSASGQSSFRSIFSQTGNYQCEYQSVTSNSQSNSIIDIADGKMRGEFRTTGDHPSAVIMIYSGGYLYTWKEGTTAGKKTSVKSVADLPSIIPEDLTSAAVFGGNLDNVSWDCHPWNKDASLLQVPSYVKF